MKAKEEEKLQDLVSKKDAEELKTEELLEVQGGDDSDEDGGCSWGCGLGHLYD
ncbi:hypothetical protein [Parabacteroides distasonis]|uniref:hypothetical protein n=1 Tax=Parabacteroides distasonis TaxID=823 RepID=UPI0018A9DA70|nr:hypothetical protein [Parabacteroides distasonis]